MKTPRKNMLARSSVTSRTSTPTESPQWVSAKDVFKSPKSPSPVRRVTRRTSLYQNKAAQLNTFKMPLSNVVSPPGVKTRARRSSIYQRRPGNLASPPTTRSRRTSMYVSGKSKAEGVNVFSKVWATPVRQPEPIQEASPEKPVSKQATKKSPVKKQTSVKKVSSSPELRAPTKSAAKRSLTPVNKASKTPKSTTKKANSTPAATSQNKANKSKTTTPAVAKSSKKSKTPSPKRSNGKKPNVVTSTPSKCLEEITGKSFYGTPGETPIQTKRTDEVFVFSAVPAGSVVRSTKRTAFATPKSMTKVKSAKKSPKKATFRKTPAPKRRRDSDEPKSSPVSKRTKVITKVEKTPAASPQKRVIKSAKRKVAAVPVTVSDISQVDGPNVKPSKVQLSPIEMTSVLQSAIRDEVKKTEKRKASESPSPRQSKQARVLGLDQPTPRVVKVAKRTSPKKLADIVDRNQSNNANTPVSSVSEVSFFNETFSTDSRSSRCTIL